MNNIQENIIKLESARDLVLNHPMCLKLVESKSEIRVIFPLGSRVDAAQVRFAYLGISKTKAFELILNTMEKYWNLF